MIDREDIIRMAREAGFDKTGRAPAYYALPEEIERFAALIAAAEREECAKVADAELKNTAMLLSMPPQSAAAFAIAGAIRSRGQA